MIALSASPLRHDETPPALPAAAGTGHVAVDLRLPADQDIGQGPIGLAPGGDDLGRCRRPEHVADGAQQGFGHMRVVLRQDHQAGVLLGDPLNRAGQDAEVVDVLRIGQHRRRQRLGL